MKRVRCVCVWKGWAGFLHKSFSSTNDVWEVSHRRHEDKRTQAVNVLFAIQFTDYHFLLNVPIEILVHELLIIWISNINGSCKKLWPE